MVKVFISYRREDSQYQTDRLYDLLSNYVEDPAKDIFLDVDNIPYGVDFVEHLEGKVSECEMVLAVIGKNWISIEDPETGGRRLENPNDFIRIEIATALKRGIPVVPVLLDGAPVPKPDQLPEDMKALSRRNGVIVNRMSFSADVETLVNGLPISLKTRSGSSPPPKTPLPPADDGGAQKMWASIEHSLDPRDYKEFQTYFANSKWSFEAGRRVRQLNDWEEVDKDDADAIAQFRGHARDIAPLFDALNRTMRQAADRALKTERASAVHLAELQPNQAPLPYAPPAETSKTAERRGASVIVLSLMAVVLGIAGGATYVLDPMGWRDRPMDPTPTVSTPAAGSYLAYHTFRDALSGGGRGPEVVVIPSGSFRMGSENGERHETPVRTVRIGYEFAVGKYEVTWAEWEACVADGGCSNSGPDGHGGDEGWGKGSRPVINVSWEDAQAYVQWLSRKTGEQYRLLSEAEWEYVARAGTSTRFSWGDGDPTCSRGASNGANFHSCTSDRTEPVGFSSANAFGLHDLHGNVGEWTQDCYVNSYSGAPIDGSARLVSECSLRVLRGGSWLDYPRVLRSAYRIRYNPTIRYVSIGFRVARSLED